MAENEKRCFKTETIKMENYLQFLWDKSSMDMIERKKEQDRKRSVESVGGSERT